MPSSDSTGRFSDRVADYIRYRPTYPPRVLNILAKEAGLAPGATIADLGVGTGISAELFLANGYRVFGVEPNRAMRVAAETQLAHYDKYRSVDGTAEETGLLPGSVDYVLAAQAFHWFDIPKTRREVARILRPGGYAILLWNTRRTDSTPFLRDYEALLLEFGTDYTAVQHTNITPQTLRPFFQADFQTHTLPNEQRFDFAGLRGRLLSSSYVPGPNDPKRWPMLEALRVLFERYAVEEEVVIEYDTEIHFGQLGPETDPGEGSP